MVHPVIHYASIPLVIIISTVAGVFALLSWRIFRNSPFGTAIALLTLGMVAMAAYHVILLATETEPFVLHVFRSAINTIIAIFIGLMVIRHRQLRQGQITGDGEWVD
ncbi:hypothetical protein C488_20907 [Natrinema pellirubrum DSM 15624]|uniref:Uncharacterized protein n=2 Tax=Natrinema pellirubrum TaxID=69525 RepID=L0JTP5_NATP1|nr:hypothetical protein Natpe_4301 [Natrinema pellirubrum DSM 15624]ELY69187.1 hypothetical protein C488_20907 [Natrinema pellirubrum DSM 15624]